MALTNNYQQAARFSVCCELHDVCASTWIVIEQELIPCLAHSKLRIQQKLKYGNWIVTRMPTPTLSDEAGTSAPCDKTTTCHHSHKRNKLLKPGNQAMLTFDGLLTQATLKCQLLPRPNWSRAKVYEAGAVEDDQEEEEVAEVLSSKDQAKRRDTVYLKVAPEAPAEKREVQVGRCCGGFS